MDNHQTSSLHETISLAKAHEQKTGSLAKALQEHSSQLHETIELPGHDAVTTLMDFIVHYIEQVPDFIEAFSTLTQAADKAIVNFFH